MFFLSLFEDRRKLTNPIPRRFPFVSIIVPAYNEETTIKKTIHSLLCLEYPKDRIEIIVVDDGSADETLKVAKTFEKQGVLVYTKENGGKGSALNLGISKCRGEFVGGLDADSFVQPDALKKIIGYFENEDVMAVAPSIKIWKPTTFLGKIQFVEFLSATIIRKISSLLGGVPITPGPFSIFRKSFFERFGGYDTSTLTEDIEISLRIESKKYIIENALDANVYTTAAPTVKKMFYQRLRWFRGFIDNVWNYRFMFSPAYGNMGVFVLPASISAIILGVVAFLYSVVKIGMNVIKNIHDLSLINFDISTWFDFEFSAFFINIGATALLPLLLLVFSFIMVYFAKRFSKEKQPMLTPYAIFIISYWFISAVCWIAAIAHKVTGKNITWGKRSL